MQAYNKMQTIDGVSSSMITMATNSTSISRLELTPWDLQYLQLDPIQKGLLFYKPKHSQDFQKTIIDHLKNSLSRTLGIFPPLAGRLGTIKNDDNTMSFFIDCNNTGAEFTYAVAHSVSVSDIMEPKYIPEIVSSFFPLNGARNCEGVSKPLLGVQVTELVDGYFIGCTANHCIVDGSSFWHFINSWSEISRGYDTVSKAPIFERWFPSNKLIPLPPLDQNHSDNFVPHPLLESVFHFSRDSLAKLKSKANSEAGTDEIFSLQALSAHLWRTFVRCRHLGNTDDNIKSQLAHFYLLVGARARIHLPDGYFGTASYVAKTAISESEILENGVGFAGMKINELVARQTTKAATKFVEDWVKNPVIHRKGCVTFVITSSPRFNVYGNDFGWGKPIAVRSGRGQKYDGKMTIFEAAEPGGIDVEACLAPETLKAMENDAEFMQAFTVSVENGLN